MFERIKNFFRKVGARMNLVASLDSITDHPKINIDSSEYIRIKENKRIYAGDFPEVSFMNDRGEELTREFSYINTPKLFARELAKLVFNEGCKISVDNEVADDFLQSILKDSKFADNFGEKLEAGYAVSGLAIRPYVDVRTKKIKLSFCSADTFFPLQSNTNGITEAAIATATQQSERDKLVYYTLLEFHEWEGEYYVISNELYRSENSEKVGVRVPLSALEKYAGLEERTVVENLTRPLFIYIKLAGNNNITEGSPLGLGICDNAKVQIRNINEKYDMFMWEVEQAKRIITASDHFFDTKYDGNGRPRQRFDRKSSFFQRLNVDGDKMSLDEFSPSLRAEEFIITINLILQIAENNIGFSQGTFSFDGKSMKTATEVVSENSRTYRTRSDNAQLVEEALKELVITIFDLARMYGLYSGTVDFGINIDLDDGIFTDKDAQLTYLGKAITFKMISRKRAMQKQFGITEKEAGEWQEEINQEEIRNNPEARSIVDRINLGNEV